MHGATLLDAAGRVLRPCILWNDGRSALQCEALTRGWPELRAVTGNLAMPGFTAPKLMWVREHEPELFARVASVLLPKAWLRWRLCGEKVEDLSDASGTLWLDVGRRAWSDAALAATGMRREQMPRLAEGSEPVSELSPEWVRRWGFRRAPLLAGGAGDNAAGAVGVGAVRAGDAFVSLGTSGVLFVSNARFMPNAARAVHAFCHAVPDAWHQMGVILSATASLEWLAGLLKTPAPKLTAALGKSLSGPSPALFLPYLSGERTPVADAQIRGLIMGIGHETDARILTHAVLDGVAFAFRDSLEALKAAGTDVSRVMAVGGGTRSQLWLKIIATALDLPVDVPADGDFGGAFGAARLGLIAATGADFKSVCTTPRIARTVKPEAKARAAYETAYGRYVQIYPSIREI